MIFRVGHRSGRPAGSAEDGEGATRGANSPVSVVGHGNRPDLHGAPHSNRGGGGDQVTVAHRTKMAGVQLNAHHLPIWSGGQRCPETRRRLGQQRRHASMEDAVGLMDLPGDREAEHHPVGSGFEDLHVEEFVNIVSPAREESAVVGAVGRRRGHRRMLPGALLGWPRD
jgi:hypothetical protein